MKAIWDNTRALDLLDTLPYVDHDRGYGVIGHSLGGHNAIFTAVLDKRIKVVATSCGFDAFPDYYDGARRNWFFGKGWCQVRYMPRLSNYRDQLDEIPFDFPDLLAASGGRATALEIARLHHYGGGPEGISAWLYLHCPALRHSGYRHVEDQQSGAQPKSEKNQNCAN